MSFREYVASALILMFGAALAFNIHDATLQGALLTAFATAYGFYLGGSKVGSDGAEKNADTVTAQASASTMAQPAGTPDDPVAVKEVEP